MKNETELWHMWSYSVNLECAVEITRQSVHSALKRRPTALLCGALHCGTSRDGSLLCGKKKTLKQLFQTFNINIFEVR